MDKNKILTKFNLKIKDYNNDLEKILENKLFSFDVKNLLLSMLYKIENAYKDYETAKVEVPSKDEYIENVLRIIQEKCLKIYLATPEEEDTDELANEKYQIDKNNGEIICFPNELVLLTAIFKIDENIEDYEDEEIEKDYISTPLKIFISEEKINSYIELIRDFNGWSWDIDTRRISNYYANLAYQCLLLINGKEHILEGEEDLLEIVKLIAIRQYIIKNTNPVFNSKIEKIKKEKEERLALFNNKEEFLNRLTIEKKEYTKQINEIDKLLNDNDLLKKEYYARNEKLPNREKIFSISYLVKILEKERTDYLEKIEENNRIILPIEFVKEKTKLEKELNFLNLILQDNTEKTIIEICKIFLKNIKRKVEEVKEENKSLLIELIYKIRYFRYIPIERNKYVRDIRDLDEKFKTIIKLIIKKSQKFKILENLTEDEETTYEILKEIFDSKIIKLQNINIQIKETEENKIIVGYYDDNVIENQKSINKIPEKAKSKKKIKIFI